MTNVNKRTDAEIEMDFERIRELIENNDVTSYAQVTRLLKLSKSKVARSLENHSDFKEKFDKLFKSRLTPMPAPEPSKAIDFIPKEESEVINIYDVSGLLNSEDFGTEKIYIASAVYDTLETISMKSPYDGVNAAMILNLINSRPWQFIVLKAPKMMYKTTAENIGRSNYATYSLALSFANQGKKVFISTSSSKLKSFIRLNGAKRVSWKNVIPTGRFTKSEMTS
ncbi:MAG: hypothetical protein IJ809_01665 [Clostridia bacterium]|nr:hypothetical protein [Clostridia bacterium]